MNAAVEWWLKAAEQGHASAQYYLATKCHNGSGILQDYAEAVKWYRLAAEQGVAVAQTNLGVRYSKGQGVLQDNVAAHMWYNIGSANGNALGGKNRDVIAQKMTPADISEAQRRAKVCMASDYQDCD